MTVLFVIPVVAMVLHYVGFSCQAQELKVGESNSNPCINVATCGACIRTASVCAWCSSSNFSRFASRCDLYEHLKNDCPKDIIYPKTKVTVAQSDNVRGGDRDRQPIQVQPQALNITARTNEPISFMLTFRQAENYPVDLYVLLDLSYTMVEEEEAQKRLIALGQEIPASLENITKDFRLGFGTFVDKTVMPYIGWTPQMLKDRCPLKDTCSPPHDFINQLKLSSDAIQFANKMKAALNAVSQSFDDSEAGMDGLIQSLACEKEIGWRERSRRIIVYSSNSMFHLAGSGKLGGATKFSDGACHLNDKGSYSPGDRIYDFPSVSQIAAKLHDKSTNIIFAVMPSVFSHYERLTKFISGAVIGILEERSANIIQLINDNYNKLRSKIDFVPRKADGIEFTLKSKCLGNVLTETSSCDGLEIKDTVIFNVSMTVTSKVCEGQSGIVERTVDLMALGLAEKLTVNLRIICDCECEHSPQEMPNSPQCSGGQGTFECGICSCNPGRYGRLCECSENDISSVQSREQCRMKGVNDTLLCSGHGECICGTCECNPLSPDSGRRYSGQYCECDDYSCQRSDDDSSLCGGPTRGVCKCGKCQCLGLWSGPACDCTTDNSTCISSSGLSCNGVGKCECGRCQCNLTTKFMGPTCEDCPNCPSKCSQYRDCAQCKGFGTGSYTKEKCDEECNHVQIVDELEEESERVRKCNFRDTENCLFHFSYQYDQQNNVVIKVQRTKVRRRSVTSPYQTTTPPRTESDKSSSKTSSYNEVDDLELTARIREEADSVEYTRPSPPTAHAHSTRTALSSHAERLIAVPQEAVTIEQAARAQQPEYVEIENEVRPNGDDGYLVPAGQYASLNPATRSEEGHEYENLGSRPTESSSTPGYSGLVKSTKREKHLYDRLRRETNQTIEAEEEDPTYAIALEQMPGPTFTKL